MKITLFPCAVFLSLLLAASIGSATGAEQENERPIIPLGLHGERAEPASYAVFGGQIAAVDLHIPASIDRTKIVVRVLQLSQSIAVRLKDDMSLKELLDPGTDTMRVRTPEVKGFTNIVFSFHVHSKDGKNIIRLGHVRFHVYPDIPLKERARPLADAIRQYQIANPSTLPAILFFGEGDFIAPLRNFLTDCDIPFTNAGEDVDWMFRDEAAASVLHIGRLANSMESNPFFALEKGHWLSFQENAFQQFQSGGWRVLPGVYSTATPGGVVTKVTLSLLPRLATDPQAQETMLHLITEAIRPVIATDVSE